VILLVSGAVSVSHALHQLLHHDASGGSHSCLACSMAKGQVSAAAVAASPALPVVSCFSVLLTTVASALPGFEYRLSPSRAPPALPSFYRS